MTILPKTKAIVFTRPMHAKLHSDIRLPEMNEDGILVKTEFSTISRGTELDLYSGQMHGKGLDTQWYPLLPGYIPVGIVEKVGKEITHLVPGDRVLGSNLFAGYDERYCPAWAGHTEWVVFSKASHPGLGVHRAVKVPSGIPAEEAGLAMLGGVAWHGVREKVKPQPGELVLVIGMGVIGNFSAQFCMALGARVVVVDWFENRLVTARLNGIHETIQSSVPTLEDDVSAYLGGEAPSVIIEVTGEMALFRKALKIVRAYGRIHAQGMYLDAAPTDILRSLFNKNLSLSCTVGETPEITQEALKYIAEGKVNTHGMLTKITDPSQASDVYDAVYRFPGQYVTCAFKW